MLNQTSQEAQYTATFVDNYLDCVENCPDDLQRRLTRMRELDVDYRACIREVEENLAYCIGIADEELSPQQARKKARAYNKIHRALITSQEVGDEKLQVVQQVLDDIELKSKQLDSDYKQLTSCIDYGTNGTAKEEQQSPDTPPLKESNASVSVNCSTSGHTNQSTSQSSAAPQNHDRERDKNDRDKTVERASKRARRTRTDTQSGDSGGRENEREPVPEPQVTQRSSTSNNTSNTATHKKGYTGTGKKKKRKARAAAHLQREETPPPEEADAIDPDEPTYCLCDQISFGEMILCDNDLCPIEWFHFSCVSLTTKPKGKWFCPKCRGDRPNIMKPKGQFLKELERYNKEKEEKA